VGSARDFGTPRGYNPPSYSHPHPFAGHIATYTHLAHPRAICDIAPRNSSTANRDKNILSKLRRCPVFSFLF